MCFHEFPPESAISRRLVRVQNGEDERYDEEESGQITSELDQHVSRLGAENIFRDPSAKGGAKSLAFRALHQNHKDHEQCHNHPDDEQSIDENRHGDAQYGEREARINRRTNLTVGLQCSAAQMSL